MVDAILKIQFQQRNHSFNCYNIIVPTIKEIRIFITDKTCSQYVQILHHSNHEISSFSPGHGFIVSMQRVLNTHNSLKNHYQYMYILVTRSDNISNYKLSCVILLNFDVNTLMSIHTGSITNHAM